MLYTFCKEKPREEHPDVAKHKKKTQEIVQRLITAAGGHDVHSHDVAGHDIAGHDVHSHDVTGHDVAGHDVHSHEVAGP